MFNLGQLKSSGILKFDKITFAMIRSCNNIQKVLQPLGWPS